MCVALRLWRAAILLRLNMNSEQLVDKLFLRCRWIAQCGRSQQVTSLIDEAQRAAGESGVALVVELLGLFTVILTEDYQRHIDAMAVLIADRWKAARTSLCAATADHQPDSGQVIVYDLRTALGLLGWSTKFAANRYDRAQRYVGDVDDVIVVDEFVGTGRSMESRCTTIRRQFSDKGRSDIRVHVFAIAGMEQGLRRLEACADSVSAHIRLGKGIGDLVHKDRRSDSYARMDEMERMLEALSDGATPPKYGDGGCEALFARHRGNCPNSVFPLFWWPRFLGTANRQPLFPRVTGRGHG